MFTKITIKSLAQLVFHMISLHQSRDRVVPGGMMAGQLDKDEVDRMTAAALTLFLCGLHDPFPVTACYTKRHPLRLTVAQTGALAATSQLGAHSRRLALSTDVDVLGHVGSPELFAARLRTHPA